MSNTSRNGTSRQGSSRNGAIHLVRVYEPDAECQVKALLALLNACTDPVLEAPPVEASMEVTGEVAPVVSTTAPAPKAAATAQAAGNGHEEPRK